jgi:hypothetical protein
MAMTEAAWFNTEVTYFVHKVFIAGERLHAQTNEAKDKGRYLRQLLSEKRVQRHVCEPDQNKAYYTTRNNVREGPVAFAESTTSDSIFAEDLNRVLQVYVDDSEKQNRKVINAIAARYDPDRQDSSAHIPGIIDRHHEFQNRLQSLHVCRVGIPYAEYLADKLPSGKTEARRVMQQVLSIIESLVVLQQHRRTTRNNLRIATLEDYAVTRALLLAPLHAALGIGKYYEQAKRLRAVIKRRDFTTPQAKQALGHSNEMATSRLLTSMVQAKLLERICEGKKGSPATYYWCEEAWHQNFETMVLPTVEEVKQNT